MLQFSALTGSAHRNKHLLVGDEPPLSISSSLWIPASTSYCLLLFAYTSATYMITSCFTTGTHLIWIQLRFVFVTQIQTDVLHFALFHELGMATAFSFKITFSVYSFTSLKWIAVHSVECNALRFFIYMYFKVATLSKFWWKFIFVFIIFLFGLMVIIVLKTIWLIWIYLWNI